MQQAVKELPSTTKSYFLTLGKPELTLEILASETKSKEVVKVVMDIPCPMSCRLQ